MGTVTRFYLDCGMITTEKHCSIALPTVKAWPTLWINRGYPKNLMSHIGSFFISHVPYPYFLHRKSFLSSANEARLTLPEGPQGPGNCLGSGL
ncbi:mCG65392 [Mus musculus]|nr:mCG65392 [Mus musculus]